MMRTSSKPIVAKRTTAPRTKVMRCLQSSPKRVLTFFSLCVFSLCVLSGCDNNRSRVAPLVATVNENASLSATAASALPANPLKWSIITSSIDPQNSTMSTLYGNDTAVQYARANSKHDYPAGSRVALVTWTRRDDPRYFGARIPDHIKSIEFVFVTELPGETKFTHEKFEGSPRKNTIRRIRDAVAGCRRAP